MPVKVLIVDDSTFFRRQVQRFIKKDPKLEIVGTAANGEEAIEKTLELEPDVITMDIEMPIMNGIEATKKIMAKHPTPILMFSSLTIEGATQTLEALDAGAIDFMPKNFEDISRNSEEVQRVLCDKIRQVGQQGKVSLRNAKTKHPPDEESERKETSAERKSRKSETKPLKVLAIGTSTGGPVALQTILSELPDNFPLPILLIQHMPSSFTPAFAKRLDQVCKIRVKEAVTGDILKPNTAYLAPGGMQMEIRKKAGAFILDVSQGDKSLTYKPSVDITFTSLAENYADHVLAVILTGMGADGSQGAKKLKLEGSEIWAQNRETSVVYGMPAAVAESGIANKVLPLPEIAGEILNRV